MEADAGGLLAQLPSSLAVGALPAVVQVCVCGALRISELRISEPFGVVRVVGALPAVVEVLHK